MLEHLDSRLLALMLLVFIGLSCTKTGSQTAVETLEKELVNLPAGVRNADEFQEEWQDESVAILILTAKNELYQERIQVDSGELSSVKEFTARELLPEILKGHFRSGREVIYLKIDAGAAFDDVRSVLQTIRDAGITDLGLVTAQNPDGGEKYKGLFRVQMRLPVGPDEEVMPNPLILVAKLNEDGTLTLNNEKQGTVSDTKALEERLSGIFKARADNGVFREDSNEVETTVRLMATESTTYGDVVKLVDALKGSGSNPILIALEESELLPRPPVPNLRGDDLDNSNSRENR